MRRENSKIKENEGGLSSETQRLLDENRKAQAILEDMKKTTEDIQRKN